MPGAKPDNERLERRVTILLSDKEYEKLFQITQATGEGMSNYIRRALKERVEWLTS